MASWSTRRRFMYGGAVLAFLALVAGLFFFKFVYHAPTCGDGIKNGDETGVDCGGACKNLCSSDALTPIVLWSKAFNISGSVYSVAAYVENPNVNSSNPQVSYEFKIYDDQNVLIASRTGATFLPKNKRFVIFEPNFNLDTKKPKRVEFDFTGFGTWQKITQADPQLDIKYSPLLATSTAPRIEGTVTNQSLQKVSNLELVGIVLDSQENAVAVSRTFIDSVNTHDSQSFVFTWPRPFNLGVESCLNPLDVALVLDRSGSMRSEQTDPPEPLSTVKATAKDFIKNLSANDRSAVISFGTNASVDGPLSANKQLSMNVVDVLSIGTSTQQQQTNIADGLRLAQQALTSGDSRAEAKKAVIMLTDGVPTEPIQIGQKEYPKIAAQAAADSLSSAGVTLYTIGLGSGVSDTFLKSLAGSDSRYFFAPTKETLSGIYNRISAALCEKKPNVITVIYRIQP